MNDYTYAASRLAAHRAARLEREAEQVRAAADRTAECVRPPVREHPRVHFPRFRLPRLTGAQTLRPAL